MFRKFSISFYLSLAFVALGSIAVEAQMAPTSGTVILKKADGTTVPVEGALVEVYRTDVKGTGPSIKTGKKGEFNFAGLMLGGVYVLAVSAPNATPTFFPNVRAGATKVIIQMDPGDGSRASEDEIRQAAAATVANAGETSAEDKKARADYEAKVKEVEERNAKAKQANEIVDASLKAGIEAYNAKNYDLAIAKFDEGIAAGPDFVGSAPVLLNNRGSALLARATDEHNRGAKATDPTEATTLKAKTRDDLKAAAEGYLKAWEILKKAVPNPEAKAHYDATRATTLNGAGDLFRIAARTEQVDPALFAAATTLTPEILAAETDVTKKVAAQLTMADLYRVTGDYDQAVAGYKKVLEVQPDNPDALAMAGICLFAQGAINNNDKAMYQEGANFLQKYVSVAPDGHRYKADAIATLEQLKNEQKVTPQKTPSGGKKKGN